MLHQSNRSLLFGNMAVTSDFPMALQVKSAKGSIIEDVSGKKYIDFISGIAVNNLGHNHPVVTEAIKQQVDKHMHVMVYGEFVQSPQVEFATVLVESLPSKLNSVYFTNSGAEAIEGALKLAKRATGRTEIVSFSDSYHGSTAGALSIMGNEYFKQAFRPLIPDVKILPSSNFESLSQLSENTAAVVIETVRGESGAKLHPQNYLKQLQCICDKYGILLIADEIQCGIGRTGTMWAFEQEEFIPDVLCTAKSLGGGMPLGAFIANHNLMKELRNNPVLGHITTFGGHPVSCAAGKAAFQLINTPEVLNSIFEKEKFIRNKLVHNKVKEINGRGLMLAAKLENFDINLKFIYTALNNGLITDWFLFCNDSFRIAPPLNITFHELDTAMDIIIKSLNEI